MSGLCGVVDFTRAPIEPEVLRRMAAVSQGLGPHGVSSWHARGVALCHLAFHSTPQSIAERQPLPTADGAVCLVADVRLDNRAELIEQLDVHGLAADGEPGEPGDAALVLAAYLRWGASCPEHLLGDFAFAIWDERRRQLFCARDPLGVKPLHYSRSGPLVCFASEAQQILQHPRIPRRLDEWTIADYLIDAWDDPERTFFRDVRKLPAAHRLLVTDRGERLERFWDVDPERRITYRDPREYTAHFLAVFERAVADRLAVPAGSVAVSLSGGLDSNSVAAMARRLLPRNRLFTCSFVFDTLRECDERDYILGSAAHLGVDAELIDTERFWYLSDSETARPRLESPDLGPEASFRAMLARSRSRGARVLLTGNGGDEMMAGSPLVYLDRLLRGDLGALVETGRHALRQGRSAGRILYRYFGEPLVPAAFERRLRRALGRTAASEIPEWIRPELVARTRAAERLPSAYTPARHPRRGAAWQELHDQTTRLRSWERSLHWYNSQANPFGIDVRHPFLDRRLVELLLAIPPRLRSQPGCYKPFLRRAMEGILPDSIRQRPDKTSLRSFMDLAIRHREQAKIKQILQAPVSGEMGILDGDKLRAAYLEYCRDETQQAHHLWYAICLELWLRANADPCLHVQKSTSSSNLMECRG